MNFRRRKRLAQTGQPIAQMGQPGVQKSQPMEQFDTGERVDSWRGL